jgi:uncharacterized Zn finger protein
MTTITAATLAKVDAKRFDKAAVSLRKGEYTVSIARNDGLVLTAHVNNGKGQSYTVSLTENGGFCSCPDYAFRATTCKHQVALAVRTLQDGVELPDAPAPNLTLAKVSPNFSTSMI